MPYCLQHHLQAQPGQFDDLNRGRGLLLFAFQYPQHRQHIGPQQFSLGIGIGVVDERLQSGLKVFQIDINWATAIDFLGPLQAAIGKGLGQFAPGFFLFGWGFKFLVGNKGFGIFQKTCAFFIGEIAPLKKQWWDSPKRQLPVKPLDEFAKRA